eukprot:6179420-Pleurochrysis_carterae.AAC.5
MARRPSPAKVIASARAGGARRPPEVLDGSVLLAMPGAPFLEFLETYRAGEPDATPTLRDGTPGPLLRPPVPSLLRPCSSLTSNA